MGLRRLDWSALLYLVMGAIVALTIVSPLILDWGVTRFSFDPSSASELGQSYGAVSALISAFALGFVIRSLFVQRRQTDVMQGHNSRMMQLELLKLAIENPSLRIAFGPTYGEGASESDFAIHSYVNLWFRYQQMNYVQGEESEAGLRHALSETFFAGETGREVWSKVFLAFEAEADNPRKRKFVEIVQAEFERSGSAGRPSSSSVTAP